ncbi:MAG: uncharacterized membrane protein YbaN (DUF454 family) [Paracoccaceae bacterium]|jgi:uncharacterized membrane protein YbaN (DUF454 family)
MKAIWFLGGWLSLALGIIGAALPLLPTVPFLLLAAFCFARSSARVHDWLLTHPRLGPPILDWQQSGAIGRRAKWLASGSIAAAFGMSLAIGVAGWVLAAQAVTLCAVSLFIWTRPDGAPRA